MDETETPKKYGILSSSANPEKLAMTVRGILVGLIPIILIVASQMGVEITQTEIVGWVEGIVGAIAALMVAYGVGRKIWLKFKR